MFRRSHEDKTKTYIIETALEGLNNFGLAQNRDQWRAVVNTVISIRFLCNAGNFLTA